MEKHKVLIMRSAVLMEDAGRPSPIKLCNTVEEADRWIREQKDQYFKPSDYYKEVISQ